ncbi:MAG: hypothetical protein H7X79_09980 [Sporomusaceae bacterium]|nr:hypothetical protein [Sporomusaceae bacterium]
MATWHREDAVRARARYIASVFIRYGFGFLVRDLGLRRFFVFGSWGGASALDKTIKSEEFRRLAQKLPEMLAIFVCPLQVKLYIFILALLGALIRV